jgi:predicted glycoside hydrolase/deacetylase ChbG (UPF0249 family)
VSTRTRQAAAFEPIARVLPMLSVPHLDREFDYLVDAEQSDDAQPGVRVRLRFHGRLVDGFILERRTDTDHVGKLAWLDRVVSAEAVLTPEISRLVDAAGRLHPRVTIFARKYCAGRMRLRDIQCELEAQIKRVMSHGISISHLDSHQHLHLLPQILSTTTKLAKKYGIPAIRFPREVLHLSMLRGDEAVSRILQLLILNIFCRLGRNTVRLRTDHFVGFFCSGNLHKQNLLELLQSLPSIGTCELMCHPGRDDANTRYRHWGYHWSEELSALVDREIAEFIWQKGIHLISYRQLAHLSGH